MFEITDQGLFNAQMIHQLQCDPGILGGDKIHAFQGFPAALGNVTQIANGGGDEIEHSGHGVPPIDDILPGNRP